MVFVLRVFSSPAQYRSADPQIPGHLGLGHPPSVHAMLPLEVGPEPKLGTGGAIWTNGYGDTLINSAMWGNNAILAGDEVQIQSSYLPQVSYSLIRGCGGSGPGWNPAFGYDGGGNLDADPLFANPAGDDLRLSLGSPAIDAGDSSVFLLPETDLDGKPRILGTTVDMGAYEFGDPTGVRDTTRQSQRLLFFIRTSPIPSNP